eukprot:scaffold32283_cov54-Attheya_sp.AAC.4
MSYTMWNGKKIGLADTAGGGGVIHHGEYVRQRGSAILVELEPNANQDGQKLKDSDYYCGGRATMVWEWPSAKSVLWLNSLQVRGWCAGVQSEDNVGMTIERSAKSC